MIRPKLTAETYAAIDDLVRLANRAVAKVQAESRSLGIPNVYVFNGRLYYETATGTLTSIDPFGNRPGILPEVREPT